MWYCTIMNLPTNKGLIPPSKMRELVMGILVALVVHGAVFYPLLRFVLPSLVQSDSWLYGIILSFYPSLAYSEIGSTVALLAAIVGIYVVILLVILVALFFYSWRAALAFVVTSILFFIVMVMMAIGLPVQY